MGREGTGKQKLRWLRAAMGVRIVQASSKKGREGRDGAEGHMKDRGLHGL